MSGSSDRHTLIHLRISDLSRYVVPGCVMFRCHVPMGAVCGPVGDLGLKREGVGKVQRTREDGRMVGWCGCSAFATFVAAKSSLLF